MKRFKRHKIKNEKTEGSSSQARDHEEHDLAYYIHDRVELMHQVFSLLKYKELKAMAPECVRDLAIGDLQELCTEELLGISSKRLLAVLDGAEPPSDTESSSPSPPPDEFETISLDSISSDEELLNASHKKKKHKHRNRRNSKKKDKPKEPETEEIAELSKASRAGLTVLELLELQARARAIRAQLQQEQLHKNVQEPTTVDSSHHSSDNEVEIKEEPADVVEISSEDEKPDINQLNNKIAEPTPSPKNTENTPATAANQPEEQPTADNSTTVTKRINDLIITVPQVKSSRKIKLNRNKVTISVPNINTEVTASSTIEMPTRKVVEKTVQKVVDNPKNTPEKIKDGKGKKRKKDKKKKTLDKDGSDHDEITLQLSDSEKMDLFENLDESRKNYDKVSSSSEDSESSSEDSADENNSVKSSHNNDSAPVKATVKHIIDRSLKDTDTKAKSLESKSDAAEISNVTEENNTAPSTTNPQIIEESNGKSDTNLNDEKNNTTDKTHFTQQETAVCDLPDNSYMFDNQNTDSNKQIKITLPVQTSGDQTITESNENSNIPTNITDSSKQNIVRENITNLSSETTIIDEKSSENELNSSSKDISSQDPKPREQNLIEIGTVEDLPHIVSDTASDQYQKDDTNNEHTITAKSISDGEISDRESSEVEAMDVRPEVVCISDEDTPKKSEKKKKKKKDKKSKKARKSKSDFRENADQNFYKDAELLEPDTETLSGFNDSRPMDNEITETIDLDSDDVCEIFELSDDSSCSEVEGTLLSKEPTAEEIEALSAKIDEIKREEVVTHKQIQEHERMLAEREKKRQNDDNIEYVSWRDRYLDSNKVKKVLTTANIFNALRKKNKELKKKIEDAKKKNEDEIIEKDNIPNEIVGTPLEEGSIEQYNTLQGSTKYVDPVEESITGNVEENEQEGDKTVDDNKSQINAGEKVTSEMRKDAKQLLKMYRRLLKYNDIKKQTDPNKKKKKKQKKKDRLSKNTEGIT